MYLVILTESQAELPDYYHNLKMFENKNRILIFSFFQDCLTHHQVTSFKRMHFWVVPASTRQPEIKNFLVHKIQKRGKEFTM